MVSALPQSLARKINLLGMNARNRVGILISIGAFMAGLRLCRICLLLVLTTVFLFELLLHQELVLDAETRTSAHLCLLFECELLLQLLRGSASGLALFYSRLCVN